MLGEVQDFETGFKLNLYLHKPCLMERTQLRFLGQPLLEIPLNLPTLVIPHKALVLELPCLT